MIINKNVCSFHSFMSFLFLSAYRFCFNCCTYDIFEQKIEDFGATVFQNTRLTLTIDGENGDVARNNTREINLTGNCIHANMTFQNSKDVV